MTDSFWTADDVERLKQAVASGVLTVRYDGPPKREVTYQDLGEMRRLLASMRSELAGASGRASYRLATTRKGFT